MGPTPSAVTGVDLLEEGENKFPITFEWNSTSAHEVLLVGSFTQWERQPIPLVLQQDGTWKRTIYLKPNTYQYKFLVNGTWRYNPSENTVKDDMGNVNNFLSVRKKDKSQKNLSFHTEPLIPKKRPPMCLLSVKRHPLNSPSCDPVDPVLMTLPNHTLLRHVVTNTCHNMDVFALTHRIENKFITVMVYKPKVNQ
ncbi:hypothetical protein PCE1_003468 [Barthelona sp. PCE]